MNTCGSSRQASARVLNSARSPISSPRGRIRGRPPRGRRAPRAAAAPRWRSAPGVRAAGAEAAARGRIERRRQSPGCSMVSPSGTIGIGHRERRHQRRGVGMRRRGEQRRRHRPISHNLARDTSPPRGRRRDFDHREVVGDEQQRQPEARLQASSRLRICAWTETSSAETGSSQTISSGSSTSARAMAMRWHWPPENSCGQRSTRCRGRGRPRSSTARTRRVALGRGSRRAIDQRLGDDLGATVGAGRARRAGPGRSSAGAAAAARSASPRSAVRSLPSNSTLPRGRRRQLQQRRGRASTCRSRTRPTSPSVSPRATRSVTPSTALHRAGRRRRGTRRAGRSIAQQRRVVAAARSAASHRRHHDGACRGSTAKPAAAPHRGAAAARSASQQSSLAIAAARRRRRSRGGAARRSGGRPGMAASRVCGGVAPACGMRAQQRLGVGHAAAREQTRASAPSPRRGRRTSPRPVGAAGDDAEIVGDEDHRHAALALLALQQVQDLRLHGDVERRGRLVGDQQLRARRRARWRSSPAGACRPTARADTGAARRSGSGMPTVASSSTARCRRRGGVEPAIVARGPRRSAARSSAPG